MADTYIQEEWETSPMAQQSDQEIRSGQEIPSYFSNNNNNGYNNAGSHNYIHGTLCYDHSSNGFPRRVTFPFTHHPHHGPGSSGYETGMSSSPSHLASNPHCLDTAVAYNAYPPSSANGVPSNNNLMALGDGDQYMPSRNAEQQYPSPPSYPPGQSYEPFSPHTVENSFQRAAFQIAESLEVLPSQFNDEVFPQITNESYHQSYSSIVDESYPDLTSQLATSQSYSTPPSQFSNVSCGSAPMMPQVEKPETPLDCPFLSCGAKFTGYYQKGNMKRHVKSRHRDRCWELGDQPPRKTKLICNECNMRFKRSDARKKHEWRTHRLESARPTKKPSASQFDHSRPNRDIQL